MDSNQIAQAFYNQGKGGKWLSRKQSEWLYNVAVSERGFRTNDHTVKGCFDGTEGKVFWTFVQSPVNHCGILQITTDQEANNTYQQIKARETAEEKAEVYFEKRQVLLTAFRSGEITEDKFFEELDKIAVK